MTHHEPERMEYGFVPEPITGSAWWRASVALERVEDLLVAESMHAAQVLTDDTQPAEVRAMAVESYRRVKAASDYAQAVYEVETELRFPELTAPETAA